jgi:hypothetical protein
MRDERIYRRHERVAALLLSGAIAIAVVAGCARPRSDTTGLAIAVNELCTTCEDFIRCDATSKPVDAADAVTLYQLKPKTFLAQLATIWDFLAASVRERKEDRRPLAIFRVGTVPDQTREAVIDLGQHRIQLEAGWIDQSNGDWHGVDDARKGQCRIIPRLEGRQLVGQLGGRVSG